MYKGNSETFMSVCPIICLSVCLSTCQCVSLLQVQHTCLTWLLSGYENQRRKIKDDINCSKGNSVLISIMSPIFPIAVFFVPWCPFTYHYFHFLQVNILWADNINLHVVGRKNKSTVLCFVGLGWQSKVIIYSWTPAPGRTQLAFIDFQVKAN